MGPHGDWLYPQLREFPAREREAALRRARRTPFDVIELVGIALSLVLVTALTRYGAAELDVAGRVAAAILNLLLAIPLIGALLAPFLVRRIRRGLDRELEARRA